MATIGDQRWKEAAVRRAPGLSPGSRHVAEVMLEDEPPPTEPEDCRRFAARLDEAAAALDELSDDDRRAVMTALHPGLGEAMARWWVDAQRQPYTWGSWRMAFRASNTPAVTRRFRSRTLRWLLFQLGHHDGDAEWLAASAHGFGPTFAEHYAGPLLAAAIDAGGPVGERVLSTLIEIGNGDHPVGVMDRHVIVALLRSARPEGWDFVERLLLAAQRQEGLRQSILEAADGAHPDAFDRMLGLVVEHDLLRFPAAVRAVCVWLGFSADVEQIPLVAERVDRLRRFRLDAAARDAALAEGDPWETYLALSALGMVDVVAAMAAADEVRRRPARDARAAAIRFLTSTDLDDAKGRLLAVLDDPDVGVAALAHALLGPGWSADAPTEAFDRLERLASRLPEQERSIASVGIEQTPLLLSRAAVVGSMLSAVGDRPLSALLPWLRAMDPVTRQLFARMAGEQKRLTPDVREALVALVGDRSSGVRQCAVTSMEQLGVNAAAAPPLESLLGRRKAGDLRRGVITLLAGQPTADAVRSAERLWATGGAAQRDAACDLLRALPGRPDVAVAAARSFAAAEPTDRQHQLLSEVTGVTAVPGADDPGLGLFDPSRRSPVPALAAPRPDGTFSTEAAVQIVRELDHLVASMKDTTITVVDWQGTQEVLLANAYFLPSPWGLMAMEQREEWSRLILPEVFRSWWADRPAGCREDDGLDSLRAFASSRLTVHCQGLRYTSGEPAWWTRLLVGLGATVDDLRYGHVVDHALSWLLVEHAGPAVVDECLDALEATFAALPASALAELPQAGQPKRHYGDDWRDRMHSHPWAGVLDGLHRIRPELYDDRRIGRWFRLMRWLDEPRPGTAGRLHYQLVLTAHSAGVATDDDVLAKLLVAGGGVLRDFTRRRRRQLEEQHPRAVALADQVRDRVLLIERSRGELATAASHLALGLGSVSGSALAVELLAKLGRSSLASCSTA